MPLNETRQKIAPSSLPPRGQWVRALSALSPADVIKAGNAVAEMVADIRHLALPAAGLALVKLREGAHGEHFYLGEMTLSAAHVEVRSRTGSVSQGAARVLADSQELAIAMAVLDAVLAGRLEGEVAVRGLVQRGWELCREEEQRRRALLGVTAADFSGLESAGDFGDENISRPVEEDDEHLEY